MRACNANGLVELEAHSINGTNLWPDWINQMFSLKKTTITIK